MRRETDSGSVGRRFDSLSGAPDFPPLSCFNYQQFTEEFLKLTFQLFSAKLNKIQQKKAVLKLVLFFI